MRNLKRLLTMVMAIAMLMSLMVVGAGATSFKDDKDITHKDAVEKMVSLNIINGRDDGNFDATGIVTRAEMAKMICVAMNGGNDPKLSSSSVVTSSFIDTKGHWAEGYIEYCVNMGIAAGLGDKTFGPDQKVTASQAAKMLLVALGYDAAYEKFTGVTWALNSNKVAQQKGLYDEIQGIDPNAPMTRDAAAQMIYNFTDTPMVKYEFGISGTGNSVTGVKQATDIILSTDSNGKVTYQTVLTKYYKLATRSAVMESVTYDSKKSEYGYKLANNSAVYYSTTDYSALIGMKVELLFRDKNSDGSYNRSDDSIYDISNDGSSIIAQGSMTDFGKLDAGKLTLKFNDVTYDIDKKVVTGTYAFDSTGDLFLGLDGTDGAVWVDDTTDSMLKVPYSIKLIDNDDNGKIDTFVVIPYTIQKVTYVGSDSVTFAGQGGLDSASNQDKKDLNLYDGIAKDDIVAYYAAANNAKRTATAVKLDLKSGVVSAVRGDGNKEVKLDGTWYTVQGNATVPKAGDTVSYAAIGTNIYYAKVTDAEATSRNVLAIYETGNYSGGFGTDVKAKVIFGTDGTKKDVVVAKQTDAAGATTDVTDKDQLTIGKMYSYKVNSDGEYELSALDNTKNVAGHDGYDASTAPDSYKSKKICGKEIADNATILMVSNGIDKTAKKYSGAELKRNYGDNQIADLSSAQILFDKTNGFNYVTVATIVVPNEVKFTSGTHYGYLTSKPGTGIEAGKDYNYYTVWTKDGEKNLKEQETGLPNVTKGDVITYNVVDGDVVKDVSLADVKTGRVDNWDDKNQDKVQFAGTSSYDVDKDTTIFNIDSANFKGVSGNTITEGNGVDANAYYIINASDKVDLIIVDLSGKITSITKATAPAVTLSNATLTGATTDPLANGGTTNLTNWISDTQNSVKVNVATAAAGTTVSNLKINDVAYTNGSPYTFTAAGDYTVTFDVTGLGLISSSYSHKLHVTAAPDAAAPTALALETASGNAATVTTDNLLTGTGSVTNWTASTNKVAFTATPAADTTLEIKVKAPSAATAVTYTTGDFELTEVGKYTVTVIASGTNMTPTTHTYTFTVAAP